MKKFLRIFLLLFLIVFCVSCGKTDTPEEPAEDTSAVARQYLKTVALTFAEGDSDKSVTQDFTLATLDIAGVTLTWTSDNTAVIAINGNTAKVTRTSEDVDVKLTAKLTYKDATVSQPFKLTVKSSGPAIVNVESITITGKAEVEVEEEVAFTATVTPANATDATVTWSSANTNVATVDENGNVTGVAEGTTTIIATSNQNDEIKGQYDITVITPIELATIAAVQLLDDNTKTKVRATVIGVYAQGYMMYDETGYMLYYVGKDAELTYVVGDTLEIVGAVTTYNNQKQFNKDAIATKIGEGQAYTLKVNNYTAESLPDFMANVVFGQLVNFYITVTKVSGSYVNATINGIDGYGVAVTYPTADTTYEVGKVYEVTGYAMYAKEYESVNYLYIMVTKSGLLYDINFDTDVENLTVDTIKFSDFLTVTLPDLYREGYIFLGWYDENLDEVKEITENKNYNLKAQWFERSYTTIEFEAADGELMFPQQFYIGNYNNYKGIVKNYDCVTIYKNGSSSKAWASAYYLKFFVKEVEAGSNVYKVTFKAGSGTDITEFLDGVTHPYDYIISSNANNPGHEDFKAIYSDENLMNYYFYFEVPENCPAKCNIKVIYSLEKVKANLKVFKYEVDEKLPDVEKDYYDFVGWYTNAEFTGEPTAFHVEGQTKYYAKYEPTTYEIAYEMNESTTAVTLPQTYNIETEDIILPTAEEMVKEEYNFLGWFDNADAAGTAWTKIAKGTHGELKLYACWAEKAVRELAVTAEDIRVLNTIVPNIIVNPVAKTANYKLVGEGLDAKYTDVVYPSGTVFASIENALIAAKSGDVIYVTAGTYEVALTFATEGVTVIGPNYGVKGTETRAAEAEITAAIDIKAAGIELNGLKLSANATIRIAGNDFKLMNSYMNVTTSVRIGTQNRKGAIAGNDQDVTQLSNIKIENNYIVNATGKADYQNQLLSFDKVDGLYVKNNYFANTASAQGTANTELIMIYYPMGTIEFIGNEFHVLTDYCIIRTGFNGSEANVKVNDNKFYSNADNMPCGMVYFAKIGAGQTYEFIGNLFNYSMDEAIRVTDMQGTLVVKYNAFLGKEFFVKESNSDGFTTETASYDVEKNYYKNGIKADDVTGAKDKDAYDTQEALNAAYAEYKGTEVQVVEYTITFYLNGGATTVAELPAKYTIDSEDITLPAADTMSVKDGTFLGWYDNALFAGDPVTVIAKGSTGDKKFYAKWDIVNVPVLEVPTSYAGIVEKYGAFDIFVVAGVDQPLYEIDGARYELNKQIFATLNDAIKSLKADQDYKIFVFAGEYNLTGDASAELMPKGSKALTIVGPNALLHGSDEDRLAEAKVTVDAQTSIYGAFTMDGLQVVGLGATKKTSNGNNYFYIKNTINTSIVFDHCILSDYRTAIYYVDAKGGSATLKITNCAISNIGQFLVWGDKASSLNELTFVGNYVKSSTFGAESNSAGSLLRIRSACTTTIVGNIFDGDVMDTTGGLFENSTQNGSAMLIVNNEFKGITKKLVYAQSSGYQAFIFNKNLYLDAQGVAATTVPDYVTGKLVTADVKVLATEEAFALAYANYLAYGMEYDLYYELNDGATTGTLVESYYKTENAVALPAADTMSKEGYTFIGWFNNAEGLGEAWTEIPAGTTGNLTMYAIWKNNSAQQLTLSADDIAAIAALNKCPDIIVCPTAAYADYTLAGEGIAAIDALIAGKTFAYKTNVFSTVAGAIAAAKEGDTIYVMAGTYASEINVNTANITLVGPNYAVAGNGTRVAEAVVEGTINVNANGFTFVGMKETSGTFKIYSNNVVIKNAYIFGIATACGSNNRLGVITVDKTSTNLTIDSCLIDSNATEAGRKAQFLTINKLTNLTFTNNVVQVSVATKGGDEAGMWYAIDGDVVIANNVFNNFIGTVSCAFMLGYNSSSAVTYADIIGNTFNGAGVYIRKLANGSVVNVEGNTFTAAVNDGISVRVTTNTDCTNTVNVKYNKFTAANGVLVAEASSTGTLVFNAENNVYASINAATTNLIKAEMTTLTEEAYADAYAAYKAGKKSEIRYYLNGGACSVELVKEFTKDSEDIVLPTAAEMTKSGYVFAGWLNVHTGEIISKIAQGTEDAFVSVKAQWTAVTPLQVTTAEAALIAAYNATILVNPAFEDNAYYSYNGVIYQVGVNAFKDLESAIAAANDAAIFLFAATTYTLESNLSKGVIIVSGSAANTVITVKNHIQVNGTIVFDGVTLSADNGISFKVDTENVKFTVKNAIVDWYNLFYDCDYSCGNTNIVVFDNVKFERAGQFVAWVTYGSSISVTNCYFNLSNGKLGTIGNESKKTALFRVRSGNMVFNNNYVTGTMPGNPYLIEYTVAGGTMTAMYNVFEDTAAPIYMNAAGTATYNNNAYITSGAPAAAPTITSLLLNGATLNLDTVFYGSATAVATAYALKDKEYTTATAVAAAFIADFNTKNSTTITAAQLDSDTTETSYLVAMMQDETLKAKWMWLYKALFAQAKGSDAVNPEAENQDFSSFDAKAFYISNLNGFFTATQHTDTWTKGVSADWTNAELVNAVLLAGPDKAAN